MRRYTGKIIRGFWGYWDDEDIRKHFQNDNRLHPHKKEKVSNKFIQRKNKNIQDIMALKDHPKEKDVVFYVYGINNYRKLVDLGFSCNLMDFRPLITELTGNTGIHKLHIIESALKTHKEIVYLDNHVTLETDISISPAKELFWDMLNTKASKNKNEEFFLVHFKKTRRVKPSCNELSDCASFWQSEGVFPSLSLIYVKNSNTVNLFWDVKNCFPNISDEEVIAQLILNNFKEEESKDFKSYLRKYSLPILENFGSKSFFKIN